MAAGASLVAEYDSLRFGDAAGPDEQERERINTMLRRILPDWRRMTGDLMRLLEPFPQPDDHGKVS
jgi:hypothetical protein